VELKNKVALITGASKGIGRATALHLARRGVRLALAARSRDLLEELAGEIDGDVRIFTGDMSVEEEICGFVKDAHNHFGQIDILINNAGLGIFMPIAETSTRAWDMMFNLNVRGLFIATREALPYLRRQKTSAIVNVASLAGKNAIANGAGYVASKHAVVGFSRSLLLEERKNGVHVLTICPGSVNTPFFSGDNNVFAPRAPEKILQADDVAQSIVHMLQMPDNAMLSEMDLRPANP